MVLQPDKISSGMATWLIFFIAEYVPATWSVIVPYARLNTSVNDATLGTLLLCLGAGAILAMPLAGLLTSRFGCRAVIAFAMGLIIISTPLLAVISAPLLPGIALLVFSVGIGVTDCAMNSQAILVEKQSSVPLMSGFHGVYSLGGEGNNGGGRSGDDYFRFILACFTDGVLPGRGGLCQHRAHYVLHSRSAERHVSGYCYSGGDHAGLYGRAGGTGSDW